nr:hypothetical protein [Lysinibacillus timonensis]
MFRKSALLATAISVALISSPYVNAAQLDSSAIEPKIEVREIEEVTSVEERLNMLELSIVGTTPEETISRFAEAVKTRNGALQYALFLPEARVGLTAELEHSHWVTGVSSPWVETYKIVSQKEIDKNKIEFQVQFDLYISTGFAGKDTARLTVEKVNERWYITSLGPVTEKEVGIWNTFLSINDANLEYNLKEMQSYESTLGYTIQLPTEIMTQLKIIEGTSENEEGKPPTTFFYLKDLNKEVLLLSIIRLSTQQENSEYYQDHPFLTKVATSDKGSFFIVVPSEHAYAENAESDEAKQWSYLVEVLKERLQNL